MGYHSSRQTSPIHPMKTPPTLFKHQDSPYWQARLSLPSGNRSSAEESLTLALRQIPRRSVTGSLFTL